MNQKTMSDLMFDTELQAKRETKFTEEHEYDLKQEAIKWVNYKIDWSDFWAWCREVKGFDYDDKEKVPLDFIKVWIEYFFHIKKEDLK